MSNVLAAGKSDIGKVRENNEDMYLISPPLYAVADGMGGHLGGEIASQKAISHIVKMKDSCGDISKDFMIESINQANKEIWEKGQTRNLMGMGTTLTMALIKPPRCTIAHVGDSRCYLLKKDHLLQLTVDHSVVGELMRTGSLSENEAMTHPHRNILTRALGTDMSLSVDVYEYNVDPGDRLLLCTDGLYSMVQEKEIKEILLKNKRAASAVNLLIKKANEQGGADNITAIVVDIT
jgi:serine/threonine protein phosphatase PrpC